MEVTQFGCFQRQRRRPRGWTAVGAQRAINSDTNILHQIPRRSPCIFLFAGGRARRCVTPNLSQASFVHALCFTYQVLTFEVKPVLRPIAFPNVYCASHGSRIPFSEPMALKLVAVQPFLAC